LEANGALKNHDVPKLMRNKANYMQFRNGMYLVLRNPRAGGKNLLEICFVEDPEAEAKVSNLTKEQSTVYEFANESAIMIIARCVNFRLHLNFQKQMHACGAVGGQIKNTQNNARTSRNRENKLKDKDNKEPQNM
jgi:hypothetical protein